MQLPLFVRNSSRRVRIGTAIAIAGALLIAILVISMRPSKPESRVIVPLPVRESGPEDVTPPPPEGNAQLILQLFNPTDQSLTHQISTTVFSQQIEQALTVSFVLTRCNLISQDDYTRTFSALLLYAQQTKLAANPAEADSMVRQLASSASASYTLVYGRTPCSDPQLPVLARQLSEWVQAVFSR